MLLPAQYFPSQLHVFSLSIRCETFGAFFVSSLLIVVAVVLYGRLTVIFRTFAVKLYIQTWHESMNMENLSRGISLFLCFCFLSLTMCGFFMFVCIACSRHRLVSTKHFLRLLLQVSSVLIMILYCIQTDHLSRPTIPFNTMQQEWNWCRHHNSFQFSYSSHQFNSFHFICETIKRKRAIHSLNFMLWNCSIWTFPWNHKYQSKDYFLWQPSKMSQRHYLWNF